VAGGGHAAARQQQQCRCQQTPRHAHGACHWWPCLVPRLRCAKPRSDRPLILFEIGPPHVRLVHTPSHLSCRDRSYGRSADAE